MFRNAAQRVACLGRVNEWSADAPPVHHLPDDASAEDVREYVSEHVARMHDRCEPFAALGGAAMQPPYSGGERSPGTKGVPRRYYSESNYEPYYMRQARRAPQPTFSEQLAVAAELEARAKQLYESWRPDSDPWELLEFNSQRWWLVEAANRMKKGAT